MGKVKAGGHVFQVLKHELCSRKLPPNAVVFLTDEQMQDLFAYLYHHNTDHPLTVKYIRAGYGLALELHGALIKVVKVKQHGDTSE